TRGRMFPGLSLLRLTGAFAMAVCGCAPHSDAEKGNSTSADTREDRVYDGAEAYAFYNPDVNDYCGGDAVRVANYAGYTQCMQGHWTAFGRNEGKRASPSFWVKQYQRFYEDLQKAYGTNWGSSHRPLAFFWSL